RLRDALKVIPAEDRDTWLKVGAALQRRGARAVWDDWSKTSGKFDAADQDRVWASFHGDRKEGVITVATIYAWAKERGWKPLEVNSEAFSRNRAQSGEQGPPVPVKIYTYDEMLAMPEACFVVDGVIVYRGKNVIFGASNTFKSFHA